MKTRIFSVLLISCILLGCKGQTFNYNPALSSGYTAGYGYGEGYYGNGVASGYRGFGGWSASYYVPGDMNDSWSNYGSSNYYSVMFPKGYVPRM